MTGEQQTILRFSALYFTTAAAVSVLANGGQTVQLAAAVRNLIAVLTANATAFAGLAALVCAGAAFGRHARSRLLDAVIGALATAIFFLGFTTFKVAMPQILPFHADPVLAELDRILHFGTDPWVLAHAAIDWLGGAVDGPGWMSWFYVHGWLLLALSFPTMLMIFDDDPDRRRRYLVLYAMVWVVLGNLLALVLLSAGPVYFDRLTGGDSFAALGASLAQAGVTGSLTGVIQDFLWASHLRADGAIGSGISAFPSVHVGIAAVLALYATERSRWLALPGYGYLAAILFLSVYLGWHYAIDGYASVAVVAVVHLQLRARSARRATDVIIAAETAVEI